MENFEKTIKKGVILVFIAAVAGLTYLIFKMTGGNLVVVLVGIVIAVFLRRKMVDVDDDMPDAIEDETIRKERQKALAKKIMDIVVPIIVMFFILSTSSGGRKIMKRLMYELNKNMKENAKEVQMPDKLISR